MTRADVIRLAREAGLMGWALHDRDEKILRFAHLVIADFLQHTGQYVTNDASREAAITEAVAPWKSAVIDQLVIAHILTAEHALKALQDLLAYHTEIAVDPRVSGAAATLVEQAKAEEREACAKVCDELFPPPSEQMTVEWAAGTVACANAIRARGQK